MMSRLAIVSAVVLSVAMVIAVARPVLWMVTPPGELRLSHFAYTDCGAKTDAGHLAQFSITPDPIAIPGNATFAGVVNWIKNQSSPIRIGLTLKKKIGIWVTLPCFNLTAEGDTLSLGDCDLADDLCELLVKYVPLNATTGQCPDPLPRLGVPCRCPLTPFNVTLTEDVAIPKLPPKIPTWLTSGDYEAIVKLTSGSEEVGCGDLYFSLKTAS